MAINIQHARSVVDSVLAGEADDRGIGTTSALAAAAMASGATVVTATADHAAMLRRVHPGLSVRPLGDRFTGLRGRFLFDHHATAEMLTTAVDAAIAARREADSANARADQFSTALRMLDASWSASERACDRLRIETARLAMKLSTRKRKAKATEEQRRKAGDRRRRNAR